MDSGADTPEGFLYETKFVVLSFLGLVPPDFDPGFSEFDVQSRDPSVPHTPFSLTGSEEGSSQCASPHFLALKSWHTSRSQSFSPSSVKSRSPALSPRGSKKKRENARVEHDKGHTEMNMLTTTRTAIHVEVDVVQDSPLSCVEKDDKDDLELDCESDDEKNSEKDTEAKQSTVSSEIGMTAAPVPPLLETSVVPEINIGDTSAAPEINIGAQGTVQLLPLPLVHRQNHFASTSTRHSAPHFTPGYGEAVSPGATQTAFKSPPVGSGDSPRLIIPPLDGQSSGSSTSEIGKDSDSGLLGVDELWEGRKRKSIEELTDPLREELQEAFIHLGLEKEYIDVTCYSTSDHSGNSVTSPTEIPRVCPIAREAIVAERIAHIGDMIMSQHKEEIEQAMQQVFGQASSAGPMNYGMFRSLVKHVVKSTVPEWYHLALMLNFTRRMAFGFMKRDDQSMGLLSDFAVRYIEENLADIIIENGGWDAMANINPEDVEDVSSRSVSSRSVSPMPSSPVIIMESPVDPPIWQHTATTQLHASSVIVSQSDVVLGNQSFHSQTTSISEVTSSVTSSCNLLSTSSENKQPVSQCAGTGKQDPIETLPCLEKSELNQMDHDQSDGIEDYTAVDSTIKEGGKSKSLSQIVLVTAAGAAAAATAMYAIMKK